MMRLQGIEEEGGDPDTGIRRATLIDEGDDGASSVARHCSQPRPNGPSPGLVRKSSSATRHTPSSRRK